MDPYTYRQTTVSTVRSGLPKGPAGSGVVAHRWRRRTPSRHTGALLILVAGALCPTAADGLPGEYLLSTRWRDLLSWHSPLTNPAFLPWEETVLARCAFAPTMQGAFYLWELGGTVPLPLSQAVGASVVGESDGQIESAAYDEATGQMVPGGSQSSNSNFFVMLSYAKEFIGRLSVGANINLAYQTNFGDGVAGGGLDLGCVYRFKAHPRLGSHGIGLAAVNLIAPLPHGNGEYSRDLRVSWVSTYLDKRIEAGVDVDLKDFWADAAEFGGDGDKRLEWGLQCRAGGWIFGVLGLYGQLGFGEEALEYWGLAGGVRVPLPTRTGSISALYQYNIKTEDALASIHSFYLMAGIGKVRRPAAPPEAEPPEAADSAALAGLLSFQGLKVAQDNRFVRITADEIAIQFESGSAELPKQALPALAEIARFLRAYPGHPVTIEGHTDFVPISVRLQSQYANNMKLSQARADRVKAYFVGTEKLPVELFTSKGYGDTQPLTTDPSPAEQSKNRRVVVIIEK